MLKYFFIVSENLYAPPPVASIWEMGEIISICFNIGRMSVSNAKVLNNVKQQ